MKCWFGVLRVPVVVSRTVPAHVFERVVGLYTRTPYTGGNTYSSNSHSSNVKASTHERTRTTRYRNNTPHRSPTCLPHPNSLERETIAMRALPRKKPLATPPLTSPRKQTPLTHSPTPATPHRMSHEHTLVEMRACCRGLSKAVRSTGASQPPSAHIIIEDHHP